jgi:hypothetical protein
MNLEPERHNLAVLVMAHCMSWLMGKQKYICKGELEKTPTWQADSWLM